MSAKCATDRRAGDDRHKTERQKKQYKVVPDTDEGKKEDEIAKTFES
jgi:hypothetical protein